MDSTLNNTRLALSILILVLIIYFYYRDVFGYAPREKCHRFIPVSCRNYFFIIFALIVILEIGYLARVGTGISFIIEKLPKYYYLGLMLLLPYLMRMIFLTKEAVTQSDDFKAFPSSVLKRKQRPKFILVILTLVLLSFGLEIYTVYSQSGGSMESIIGLIGESVYHPDQLISVLSKTRLLEIPILLYLYKIYVNYSACSYDLPKNWNY